MLGGADGPVRMQGKRNIVGKHIQTRSEGGRHIYP